jgi:hypothetical protein
MNQEPSKRPTASTKWNATNDAANSITDAWDTARHAKTSRLRELRLAKELSDAAETKASQKAHRATRS